MAIVNRDLETSEQRHVLSASVDGAATGVTYALGIVPFQSKLISAMIVAKGLSGAPVGTLWNHRFIPGTGFTSIVMGTSVLIPAFGVSGGITFGVLAAGVTNPLQSGDVLTLATGVANTGAERYVVTYVIQALQDIRSAFGV